MKYVITFIVGAATGIGGLLMRVWLSEEHFKYYWPRNKKGKGNTKYG